MAPSPIGHVFPLNTFLQFTGLVTVLWTMVGAPGLLSLTATSRAGRNDGAASAARARMTQAVLAMYHGMAVIRGHASVC